jgi:hypothetical protein
MNIKDLHHYERECPKCKKILVYTDYCAFRNALNKNKLCRSCVQIGKWDGAKNNFARKDVIEKIQAHYKDPEWLKKFGESVSKGQSEESRQKAAKRFREHNPAHNTETLAKRIDTYTKRLANGEYTIKNNWKTGYYKRKNGNKEWYDSSLELRYMQHLDSIGVVWTKKHGIRIPYKRGELKTFYVPDFLVENELHEIKGWLKKDDILKAKIAKKYCQKHNLNYRFILGEHLEENTKLSYIANEIT